MRLLRNWIREFLLYETAKDDSSTSSGENLLIEPDEINDPEQEEQTEMNTTANIGGVITPLGTGPTYPGGKKKRKKKRLPKGWQKSKVPPG